MPKAKPARPVTKAAANVPHRNIATSSVMASVIAVFQMRLMRDRSLERRAARASAVRLVGGVAAPAIEGVVMRHRRLELGEIVAVHAGVAQRCREQTARLRRQIKPARVCAAHDPSEPREGFRAEAELLEHHIEGALVPAIAPERLCNVEGRRLETIGNTEHLGRRDKQKGGLGIKETSDQPRASDANDLGPGPRHPDRPSGLVALRQLVDANKELMILAPFLVAAFERLRCNAVLPEAGRGALAQLQAGLAGDDDRLAGIVLGPLRHGPKIPTLRGRDQARIGPEFLIGAHVDEQRRTGGADETRQLRYGDFGW